jgi:hypothetical protein
MCVYVCVRVCACVGLVWGIIGYGEFGLDVDELALLHRDALLHLVDLRTAQRRRSSTADGAADGATCHATRTIIDVQRASL